MTSSQYDRYVVTEGIRTVIQDMWKKTLQKAASCIGNIHSVAIIKEEIIQ